MGLQIQWAQQGLAQAGLELLTSSDPPASASQSARITGVSHRARPILALLVTENLLCVDQELSLVWSIKGKQGNMQPSKYCQER
uniref:Uncharacterized protein n=1 Tax=Prolemur simus TaxID=1328070 RepID=A0A8C8ZGE3_PROSS